MKAKKQLKPIMRGAGSKFGKAKRTEIFGKRYKHAAEVRDVMTSTGAIVLNRPHGMRCWANDLDPRTIMVLRAIRDEPLEFLERCRAFEPLADHEKAGQPDYELGKKRLRKYWDMAESGQIEDQAVGAFIMNRLAHSTRTRSSVQYASAFDRWNIINDTKRFLQASEILQGVKLTVGDYRHLLSAPGDQVWCFIDAPYVSDTERNPSSRLYSHPFEWEDHEDLAEAVRDCKHPVMLTYDDHPFIRDLYPTKQFHIFEAEWVYSVSSARSRAHELIITNYDTNEMPNVIEMDGQSKLIDKPEAA